MPVGDRPIPRPTLPSRTLPNSPLSSNIPNHIDWSAPNPLQVPELSQINRAIESGRREATSQLHHERVERENDQSKSNFIKIRDYSGTTVSFKVTPEISESKSVSYIEISEIRQAASILIFNGSPGRQFNVNVKLVSRTPKEADDNFRDLNIMKMWSVPTKGGTRYNSSFGDQIEEDSPTLLYLYGYGNNFKGIQMVMKSINIEYQSEVDYILSPTHNARMPIIMPVSMTFQEIRSGDELSNFNIEKYKRGELEFW